MRYRFLKLLALKNIAADQIVEVDLDMRDPISQIFIDHRVTNGIGTTMVGHPMAAITKAEIIDGSDVLFNLDGECMEALDVYHSGKYPRGGWFNALNGTRTDRVVAINFGRYPWDRKLALDPRKFSNPKLRITYDYDAGGMAPSSCDVAVYANLFDQKRIEPDGFLMAKEIKSWVTVAAQHEYTDLPTDYAYRKLLLKGAKTSNPLYWILGNIKLSEDGDKRVVLDHDCRSLLFGIGAENAFIEEQLTCAIRDAQNVFCVTPGVDVMCAGSGWEEAGVAPDIIVTTFDGDGGHLEANANGAGNAIIHIQGWAPHNTLQIPFGKQEAPGDWYNVKRLGNLKLDVTDGVDTATTKLFLQQYRTY